MPTWEELTSELYRKGLKPYEITEQVEKTLNQFNLYDRIQKYIKRHCLHPVRQPEKIVSLQNQDPKIHDRKWTGNKTIRFGLLSDTHIGSKYTQLTYLHEYYNRLSDAGITDVYHAGDITEGLKMRPGHEYEVYVTSSDELTEEVINNYPSRSDMTTHFITGNHDSSIYKLCGHDIGREIIHGRSDLKYLGRDCAVINLTPNCTLELRHPWDGTAYAISYKPQKMIESMEADSKPNILAIGHYHKCGYFPFRSVHSIQTGCFQGQTPFTRGKGISVSMGGWIIEAEVDSNGYIQKLNQEFVPYYKAIKDDYLNWR